MVILKKVAVVVSLTQCCLLVYSGVVMLIPLKVHKHTYIKHPFSQHTAAIKVKNHIKYPGGMPKGPTPYLF